MVARRLLGRRRAKVLPPRSREIVEEKKSRKKGDSTTSNQMVKRKLKGLCRNDKKSRRRGKKSPGKTLNRMGSQSKTCSSRCWGKTEIPDERIYRENTFEEKRPKKDWKRDKERPMFF